MSLTDAPSQPHSPTSQAAARGISPDAKTLRGMVHGYLLLRGGYGATDEEIQEDLVMNPSTQRPRRVELVKAGVVEDSSYTRRTNSGRKAVVWRVVA